MLKGGASMDSKVKGEGGGETDRGEKRRERETRREQKEEEKNKNKRKKKNKRRASSPPPRLPLRAPAAPTPTKKRAARREPLPRPPSLAVRPSLAVHGCVVLDVLSGSELERERRRFAKAVRKGLRADGEEPPPTYTFTDRYGPKTKPTQLVGGGFGALAHFSSAFGRVPDRLRRRAHEAFVEHLEANVPRERGPYSVECVPDRALERQPGESYGGSASSAWKSVHRDRCPVELPTGAQVFGGWLAMDGEQSLTFEPGSAQDERTGSFDKLDEAAQAASYRRMVTVTVLPGQALFFRQTVAHAVTGSARNAVMRRLFLAAVVTPGETASAPLPSLYDLLGVDLARCLNEGKMPPVKSGEPCAVFPRNWYGFNTPRLQAWARAVFGVDDVVAWTKERLGGFGKRELPSLAAEGRVVPDVDKDLFLKKTYVA